MTMKERAEAYLKDPLQFGTGPITRAELITAMALFGEHVEATRDHPIADLLKAQRRDTA